MRFYKLAVSVFLLVLTPLIADAFPSWMGVYGSNVRHNGGNPGTFTVLMNQDYYGLHAEVALRVNGGSWSAHEMIYVGNADGNSVYQFTPSWEFPATQIVEFYFYGWDNWGGNIWDSNYGQNYWFPAYHNGRVQWVGNSSHWPASGSISSNDNLWVNIQSWPSGAAKESRVVYTTDRGLTWLSSPMSFNGVSGNNDAWNVNLGTFRAAETVRYAIEITDWAGAKHWDNNGGFDFYAQVNYGNGQDEDGDGMPNGWEIAHGFDPTDPIDADDDKDGDELVNHGEFLAGSNPSLVDTDGDGLEDSIEALGTLTSPTNEQSHSIVNVLTIDGATGTNLLGVWYAQGTAIAAAANRGSVQYYVQVPAMDVYFLEINGANSPYIDAWSSADLDVYVDDVFVKRVTLPATTNSASARCPLPMLAAGQHQVELFWDNAWKYNRLRIDNLKLQSLSGVDADANGVKDWVESWTLARNGADLLPPSSAVSPAFIEGRAAFPNLTVISGGVQAMNGAGRRWYADVPLSPATSTSVTVTLENGALIEDGEILWRPTNVLLDDSLSIREGDSLLLTAYPLGAAAGSVLVEIQGVGSFTTTVESPIPYQFAQEGSYVLAGSYADNGQTYSDSITVNVVRASFPDSPAAWVQHVRPWACSNIVNGMKVQMDPSVRFVDSGSAGNGRCYNMLVAVAQPQYAVARLGSTGPIIDSAEITGFRLSSASETYVILKETFPDGSTLVETGITLSPVPAGVVIRLEVIAGGVTFDDGSIVKVILPWQLDDMGQIAVRLIRAAGVQTAACHQLKVYQNGILLGVR